MNANYSGIYTIGNLEVDFKQVSLVQFSGIFSFFFFFFNFILRRILLTKQHKPYRAFTFTVFPDDVEGDRGYMFVGRLWDQSTANNLPLGK